MTVHSTPVRVSCTVTVIPGDSIEAMLVAQMVSVHVMAMRCGPSPAGEPTLWHQNSFRRRVPLTGGESGKRRCRMRGGAQGSGALKANQNARKHGLFTEDAIVERRQIQALFGETRKLKR